jgi:hypothetical protein
MMGLSYHTGHCHDNRLPPKLTRRLSNVAGVRPNHAIALVLLDRMPDPANGSADRKQIDSAVGCKT